MASVAVATSSRLAAAAAEDIASLGGNAVDCALSAALVSINTQPGVCALAGSAYISIWRPGEDPITIDGNVAVPGLGRSSDAITPRPESVSMDYGGGISTVVGCPSVAVPGTPAALGLAADQFGTLPWKELLQPSIAAAAQGFPLPKAARFYLEYSGDSIYGRSAEGHAALHRADGSLLAAGDTVVVPGLAETLEHLARAGVTDFYRGEIGQRIVAHVQAGDGLLNAADMHDYAALVRPCLRSQIGDWQVATNPPPAVGGAVLLSMLETYGTESLDRWSTAEVSQLAAAHFAVLQFRRDNLDLSDDRSVAAQHMLELARDGELLSGHLSGSTVHTSAVDRDGLACAITASAGYGSGEIPDHTGLWLNNCLGELELNRRGLSAGPAGARLPSNMTPTICRRADDVIALGSPGADRITSALHQFIIHALQRGLPLPDAVASPRLHVDMSGDAPRVMCEPGLPHIASDLPSQVFDELSMYFGGVAAARFSSRDGFEVAADQRREGGVFVGGG